MGDSPFDPCECIFSPAGAMRRLISLLRSSQQYCTDEQCFGTPTGPSRSDETGMMYMVFAWVVLALVLYLVRPQSLKSNSDVKKGPANDDHGNGNNSSRPPQPPPVI